MARPRKTPNRAILFRALKEAGVEFDRHYRTYKAEELQVAYDQLVAQGLIVEVLDPEEYELDPTEVEEAPPAVSASPRPEPIAPRQSEMDELKVELAELRALLSRQTLPPASAAVHQEPVVEPRRPPGRPPNIPDPTLHAGVTLNTHAGEPIRTDESGRIWYQNEVPKPAFPKPRGRRVLRDMDPGVVTESIKVGEYIETFEVPGDMSLARPSEVKVTLPSYQTGIFKEPGMPFRIHVYNGARGFDFDDVNAFFGHPDLVPSDIRHIYVSSDLCYDISTTIRAIENEYRERVLRKEALR